MCAEQAVEAVRDCEDGTRAGGGSPVPKRIRSRHQLESIGFVGVNGDTETLEGSLGGRCEREKNAELGCLRAAERRRERDLDGTSV
jgi:hypothetical protein